MSFRRNGFTLSEVLITLGIIGIIATLTIPNLVAGYQKVQYVAALKKAYSTWNQALVQMAADGGCVGDLSCFFDSNDINVMGNKISKYFKPVKVCKSTYADNSGCYHYMDEGDFTGYMQCSQDAQDAAKAASDYGCFPGSVSQKYTGVGSVANEDGSLYRFVQADGTAIQINNVVEDCPISYAENWMSQTYLKKICGTITIDTNGMKGPNAMGRDVFSFSISNGKGPLLYPMDGGLDDSVGGKTWMYWKTATNEIRMCGYNTTTTWGSGCAARIIDEGWQMNY